MIKICKKPYIYEELDRWNRPLGTYSVREVWGYVEEQFWADLKEFEGYRPEDDSLENQTKTLAGLVGQELMDAIEKIKKPKMERLIGRVKSQLWQFNMLRANSNENDVAEYIRSYAIFGEKTLEKCGLTYSLRVLYLKIKCKILNLKGGGVP